jgi:hypothetical protein
MRTKPVTFAHDASSEFQKAPHSVAPCIGRRPQDGSGVDVNKELPAPAPAERPRGLASLTRVLRSPSAAFLFSAVSLAAESLEAEWQSASSGG